MRTGRVGATTQGTLARGGRIVLPRPRRTLGIPFPTCEERLDLRTRRTLLHSQANRLRTRGHLPEHLLGWRLAEESIAAALPRRLSILNLFAYSGGATLACAKAGAEVCHLDASRKMTDWARDNANANHLQDAPVRWIVDDVTKFLNREIRRGRKYDGIILDPPSFGRGTSKELFQIDQCMLELLDLCRQCLSDTPSFALLTCHTPGYTPLVLSHLAAQSFPEGEIKTGEMILPVAGNALAVPSGAYAFWQPK